MSVAEDLGYIALADLARTVGERDVPYRIIGGHMVTALAARWRLGADLFRETGDTDLGVPPVGVKDDSLIGGLEALGYARVSGNRFAKVVDDIPVHLIGGQGATREAMIDVLVPTYDSKVREKQAFGRKLVTIEVPGLATALKRPAISLRLTMQRLNHEVLDATLDFPDEPAALVLKGHATAVRDKATDLVDVWRCLEVCFAADVRPDAFDDDSSLRAAATIRERFHDRNGPGMTGLLKEQRLSTDAADARHTRITALIERILPS